MFDQLMRDIGKLHQQIQRNDRLPVTERERQALFIFTGMQRVILELIYDKVGMKTLELVLLYNWLRLATLLRGYDEAAFSTLSGQLDKVMGKLVATLKSLEPTLDDKAPSAMMSEIGSKIQRLRDQFGPISEAPLSQQEIQCQTEKTTKAIMLFTDDCLQQGMHPGLLESASLYYWLRTSTIHAAISEDFFQKMERHWPSVLDRVGEMIGGMLGEIGKPVV